MVKTELEANSEVQSQPLSSIPSEKEADRVLAKATPVAEQFNMAFAGTTIVRGRGTAVVVATGMLSELGRTTKTKGAV